MSIFYQDSHGTGEDPGAGSTCCALTHLWLSLGEEQLLGGRSVGQGRQGLGEPSAAVAILTDTVGSFVHVGCASPSNLATQATPLTLLCLGAAYLSFTPFPRPLTQGVHHLEFAV